ncbi:DUF2971 domain-containing protein [Pseudomonadota bacterium]
MKLYKYRDTSNIKFLLDILVNKRLHAASYQKMKNPMEEHYLDQSAKLNPEFRAALHREKDHYGICSLYKEPHNHLLWSHYADDHRGLAFGVTVDDPDCMLREVKYSDMSAISSLTTDHPADATIQMLSHKLDIWDYEKEHRAFVKQKQYVGVKVHEVIFGRRADAREKSFLTKMIKKVSLDIEVKDELDK